MATSARVDMMMTRARWRLLVAAMMTLPLLPAAVVAATALVASVSCKGDDIAPCVVASIHLADIVSGALEISATRLLDFSEYSETLLLALFGAYVATCYTSIIAGWSRLSSRLAIGGLATCFFVVVPFSLPQAAVALVSNSGCIPSTGGKPCVLFGKLIGKDQWNPVADAVALSTKLAPSGLFVLLIAAAAYVVVTLSLHYWARKITAPREDLQH